MGSVMSHAYLVMVSCVIGWTTPLHILLMSSSGAVVTGVRAQSNSVLPYSEFSAAFAQRRGLWKAIRLDCHTEAVSFFVGSSVAGSVVGLARV